MGRCPKEQLALGPPVRVRPVRVRPVRPVRVRPVRVRPVRVRPVRVRPPPAPLLVLTAMRQAR